MYQTIKYDQVKEEHILIDVRTPGEYEESTIPGAFNIPIFSNEERKEIGTLYKNESVEKAKKLGIDAVSKNLPHIYQEIVNLSKDNNHLVLFCARGGFRSGSLVSLLSTLGFHVKKLEAGYKGYRKYMLADLDKILEEINFIVLYGNTGTGKTKILKSLEDKGENILDLEGYANHRGSILGSVGLGKQNSQKKFESLIYENLRKRNSNLVFIEGESRRIGKDVIPEELFKKMKDGIHIKIEASKETRIDNLLEDYVHETSGEIIESLNYLRKHVGDKNIDNYVELINRGDFKKVGEELMLKYYDPLYKHNTHEYKKIFYSEDSRKTADELIQYAKNENLI